MISRVPRLLALLLLLAAASTQAAPMELKLPDLNGETRSLSELHDEIVVLNFWATWCAPCRSEMPLLSRFQNEYGDRGVQVLGVARQPIAAKQKIEEAAKSLRLTFPTWLGATTQDMDRLGLGRDLPATVVLDREGRPVARFLGVVFEEDLREVLDKLLAK
jgi:thiol-disulfide isomerase/thioredoxin